MITIMDIIPNQDATGSQVMLNGQLDNSQCDALKHSIERLADNGAEVIELNCSRLRFMTGAGAGQINALLSRYSQLRLTQVSEPVAALLQLCGIIPSSPRTNQP
ncbi:STAS domain-containing protein [Thalassomonas actiniarum]|uniref:STAS domain-containing protein n=1 Tax=Thalassomonas actiniarum TaxID=485447 RepID=A0AAE9YVZ8_9GAMM|nr:STAS domain-containing protein [Thalassomonas actiniarum]WDE02200.1 STAS domain-containing protein [Thalassomonas actiniarum]